MHQLQKSLKTAFDQFPPPERAGAMELRNIIFEEAARLGVTVVESLKWGQPSYLAPNGTPIRIGLPKTGGFAVYTHCQSSVISDFATLHGSKFKIEGNRAVHFSSISELDAPELRSLITHALLYKEKRD